MDGVHRHPLCSRHNGGVNFPLVVANRLRPFTMPIVVIGVIALIVTFFVVPVRTWTSQRDLLDSRSTQYGVYEEVNDALQDEVDALTAPRACVRRFGHNSDTSCPMSVEFRCWPCLRPR